MSVHMCLVDNLPSNNNDEDIKNDDRNNDKDNDSTLSSLPPQDAFEYPSIVINITQHRSKPEPLHQMRPPSILECVEVENGQCGCYLAFELGKRDHYQLYPPSSSSTLCDNTKDTPNKNNIAYQQLSRTSSHHISDVVTVINHGTPKFLSIQSIMDKLPFQHYLDKGLEERVHTIPNTQSAHAPITWSYGYSSQHSQVPTGGTIAVPIVIGDMDTITKQAMVTMTYLLSTVCAKNNIQYLFTTTTNNKHILQFAQKLIEDDSSCVNDVEGMLISITIFYPSDSSTNQTFERHVDSNNDPRQDYTLCAYRFFTCDNVVYRVAILAYSRKSIDDFFDREKRVATYTTDLQNFIQDHKHVWYHDPSVSRFDNHVSPCTSTYALSENVSMFIDAFMDLDRAWCGLTRNIIMELLLPVLFVDRLNFVAAVYYEWTEAKPHVVRRL